MYTQLFRLCWLSALSHGLDPYLGVLHEGNERYAALAADLQEPFRFLCERLALELFRRGTLKRDDFIRSEKRNPPLRLKTEALKRTLTEWEKRLEARVQFGDETRNYRGHIAAQAERCAQIVRGERAELSAFRLKW